MCLRVFLWTSFVAVGLGRLSFKDGRKKGLLGYDLVNAMDRFWGSGEPDTGGPRRIIDVNNDGTVDGKDWKKLRLPEEHFKYFDKDGDGVLNVDESYSWWMQRKPAATMDLSEVENPPRGHLQKLGAWKDPYPVRGARSVEDLTYTKPYPHPRKFWRKHMDGFLPAVLKGAQDGWPAMNWTREVLLERFGWVDAKIEPKREGRLNKTAYKDMDALAPNHRLSLKDYLRVEKDKNVYVVSIIPQIMAWEVAHPSVLLCGSRRKMVNKRKLPYSLKKHDFPHEANYSWMTHLFEANLWIASGRTRSQFHYDKEWNVNCLLSGRKRWFFIDPFKYDEELQWARGNKFRRHDPLNNAWTDWVFLDPDNVDLIVQHKLRKMDYYELIQEPGDCIFIPYAMLHQVDKLDDGLQVAASWMFLPETIYDEEACAEAPLDEDLPLATMDTLYMYTGKGLIPQGYADPLNFVHNVQRVMKQTNQKHMNLQIFTQAVSQGEAILASIPDKDRKIRRMFKLLAKYAADPKKGLTEEELRKVPMRLWCKPAAEGDEEGPLPCDKGQEYHFCDDKEFQTMKDYVDAHLPSTAGKVHAEIDPADKPTHQRMWKHDGSEKKQASSKKQEL